MLSEQEIRERAEYCYLVFLQLSWLLSNDFLEPSQYLEVLKKSSLGLGDDAFIVETIRDSLLTGREDGGLSSLLNLYEGFFTAFCEVLQIRSNEISEGISPDDLEKLAAEMGVKKNPIQKT
jgi:hypothetical protein